MSWVQVPPEAAFSLVVSGVVVLCCIVLLCLLSRELFMYMYMDSLMYAYGVYVHVHVHVYVHVHCMCTHSCAIKHTFTHVHSSCNAETGQRANAVLSLCYNYEVTKQLTCTNCNCPLKKTVICAACFIHVGCLVTSTKCIYTCIHVHVHVQYVKQRTCIELRILCE